MKPGYTPSCLLPGDPAILRELTFTRWMSRDLLQAASDFLRNLHLIALYAETSPEGLCRYLCWHPPKGCAFEVHSGRTREQFEQFDQGNIARGWALLTLHVNESDIYSAVWISPAHLETATAMLARYGISPAVRENSAS
jgi:hypothetical protein